MARPSRSETVSENEQKSHLSFRVAFDGKPEKPIDVIAFAFSAQGELLARAPLKEGHAQLALTDEQARGARIFFAALPEGMEHVSLETMSRIQAYEPTWTFDPKQRAYKLLPIPEALWKWWFWCRCRVRGQVVKPVMVEGVTYDKPVCNARVHICEVDRLIWLIPRLPDDILRRLRDELLVVLERPRPFPEPDPPPFVYDPGVIDPSPVNVARMVKASQATTVSPAAEVALNPQPVPPRTLGGMPAATRAALMSSSLPVIRQALIDQVVLIPPWICRWPWLWPYLCRCDEIAVVTTDHAGRFDTEIWYPCFGDHPDLYFWAEFMIGGVWTTVYHPIMCCNTYWDYVCGSDVTIRVTDPRVPWCGGDPPLPGKQLAVLSIGHNLSMTQIQRASAGTAEGLTTAGQPLGGSLEPDVWFGDGLIPSGVTHYRWSYRRLGSTGDWTALDHQVVRHYAEIMADSTLVFKPFDLGPDPAFAGKNLFQIRPADPPLNIGAVSSSWAPEVDARVNTASGYFLSHLLSGGDPATAAGQYELKLELFHSDGTLVNLTDDGVLLKVPTVDAPFGLGIVPTQLVAHAPALPGDMEDRVIRDGAGKIVAFRLVLHVDNNPTTAEIEDVTVNGTMAGPCGFISYTMGSDAVISFVARHPNDFATFSFLVTRGSSGVVAAASASGSVVGPAVNGFVRNMTSLWVKSVPVATLLGPCPKAAFAETLHVDALATDGWSTLEYLDADAIPKAFALEPA